MSKNRWEEFRMHTEENEGNHPTGEPKTENAGKESAIARLEARIAELQRQIRENKGGKRID